MRVGCVTRACYTGPVRHNSLHVALKHGFIRRFWGQAFYDRVIRPFDAWLVPPQPSNSFESSDLPLNKVCRVADAANPAWRQGYRDLGFPEGTGIFHRKVWEFNQTLYGLRTLRRLPPQAVALGIGCGHEELMYFLANRLARVVATDIYEDGFLGGESNADVLEDPAKYAPFNYREDHLEVRRMNGLALDARDGTFDFVFCLSSIEHFGRIADKLRALREMYRVLKPGGVAVVTTEVVLNRLGRGTQYFQRRTLLALVRDAGFVLEREPDFRIEAEYASLPLALPMDTFVTPHVVLRNFNTIYTSVSLFMMKPEGPDPACRAAIGDEVAADPESYHYQAEFAIVGTLPQLIPAQPFTVTATVRNAGSATWFTGAPRSHVVRIGAWLTGLDGRNLTGEPVRFDLPHHVRPGEQVDLSLRLTAPRVHDAGVRLHVGLVKELCFWFRDKGAAELAIPLAYEQSQATAAASRSG